MKNLEQLRARHAYESWEKRLQEARGEDGGDVVRGLPALIVNNGLLATLAFAKDKGKGHESLLRAIGQYLAEPSPNGPAILKKPCDNLDSFIGQLASGSSALLQMATNEALAYLSYLKRFAP